jgi:hypothetical protein
MSAEGKSEVWVVEGFCFGVCGSVFGHIWDHGGIKLHESSWYLHEVGFKLLNVGNRSSFCHLRKHYDSPHPSRCK